LHERGEHGGGALQVACGEQRLLRLGFRKIELGLDLRIGFRRPSRFDNTSALSRRVNRTAVDDDDPAIVEKVDAA
jgi:hypothetical protein